MDDYHAYMLFCAKFLKNDGSTNTASDVIEPNDSAEMGIETVLKKYYQYGFKYESIRELMRFRQFADTMSVTGMEFPDTYEAVKYTEEQCLQDNTPFYIARSHFTPQESWDLFGPPSRTLRWCCSVHKSTPQTLKMREITGKNDYAGLDYVGVRKHESLARSTYEYENYGKKQKGQRSFNPLLEWTSAEIWLYIFSNKIYINNAYKKGNSRAGCLLCPMAGGSSDYIRRCNYPDEIDGFIDIIKRKNNWDNYSEAELHSYVS